MLCANHWGHCHDSLQKWISVCKANHPRPLLWWIQYACKILICLLTLTTNLWYEDPSVFTAITPGTSHTRTTHTISSDGVTTLGSLKLTLTLWKQTHTNLMRKQLKCTKQNIQNALCKITISAELKSILFSDNLYKFRIRDWQRKDRKERSFLIEERISIVQT